jgi:beta-glucosidase
MTQPTDITPEISIERLDALVRSLSIEERAQLTSGIDAWHAAGVDSIGLGQMLTLDGPNGVRGMTFPKGSSATCTPCGTALGATWDVDLVAEVAARIGSEAKRGGIHYMLGPVLNLVRSPLAGRDFECYSEDPLLIARLGVAYVTGMQSQGVAACPKHFVANDSETHRTTVNCIVDERTLREVYLLPFEAVAKAGAWSMMAAYNRVNGVHCSNNAALVGGVLREEWGWDGVLMSDWDATHDTVADASAGLDLEMPGPPRYLGPHLAAAVRRGEVDEETLNSAALHVLTLAARVGALPVNVTIAGRVAQTARTTGSIATAEADPLALVQLSDAAAAALVRRVAADAFVLLANDGVLPLAAETLRQVAVIGPNAANPCTQGGGAAHISAPYAISPLDGLRAAFPAGVEIVHEPGPGADLFLPPLTRMDLTDLDGRPGLTIEFYRGQEPVGEPVARFNVRSSDVHLFGDLPAGLAQDDFAVRISAWLTPAITGPHEIAIRGLGGRRLLVDGVPAADEWDAPGGVDIPTALFEAKEKGGTFEFQAGKRVHISAEAHSNSHSPSLLTIGCAAPEGRDLLESAVAAAASADVAIVVVGTDETWESEGRDRKTVTLPGRQNELVERVAAVNRKTVVVVNAGCPMDLPWADRVAAVIYAWLPGQEFGNALADVLLGIAEPGGRLPVTLARRAGDFPAYDTTPGPDEKLIYTEGVNVGYRGFDVAGVEPRFAFGHGLGYTTLEYESLSVAADGLADGEPVELRVKIRNTGARSGKEVVQVYVSPQGAAVQRPPHELKAFAVVRLKPGEMAEIAIALEDRDLAFWDVKRHNWHVEPGRYEIQVGHSSRDIRLRSTFELA